MNKIAVFTLSAVLILSPKATKAEAAPADAADTQAVDLQSMQINLNDIQPIQAPQYELKDVTIGMSEATLETPAGLKSVAQPLVAKRFGAGQFSAFDAIITHESGWNVQAVNRSSGACGLGQALPCSKMGDQSPLGQIEWVIGYIAGRYGTPANAWATWQSQGWY